jgi:hypothetical protein
MDFGVSITWLMEQMKTNVIKKLTLLKPSVFFCITGRPIQLCSVDRSEMDAAGKNLLIKLLKYIVSFIFSDICALIVKSFSGLMSGEHPLHHRIITCT